MAGRVTPGAHSSLLVIEQLANLLAAIGALLMALRRRASLLTRQLGLAALAATSCCSR